MPSSETLLDDADVVESTAMGVGSEDGGADAAAASAAALALASASLFFFRASMVVMFAC